MADVPETLVERAAKILGSSVDDARPFLAALNDLLTEMHSEGLIYWAEELEPAYEVCTDLDIHSADGDVPIMSRVFEKIYRLRRNK